LRNFTDYDLSRHAPYDDAMLAEKEAAACRSFKKWSSLRQIGLFCLCKEEVGKV
jgi:hypothetical protein